MRVLLAALWVAAGATAARGGQDMYCGEHNCYQLLRLDEGRGGPGMQASGKEIKKAFRKLSVEKHPDRVAQQRGDVQAATAEFQEIVKAYEVLSDEDRRKDYDYYLNNPHDVLYNQMRYYQPKMDIRVVAFGVLSLLSVIHYLVLRDTYKRQLRNNSQLLDRKVQEALEKKGVTGTENVKQEEKQALEMILDALDSQGVISKPRLSSILLVQLLLLPIRVPGWIKSSSRARQAREERARQQKRLEAEKEQAEKQAAIEKEQAKQRRFEEQLELKKRQEQDRAQKEEEERRALERAKKLERDKVNSQNALAEQLKEAVSTATSDGDLLKMMIKDIEWVCRSELITDAEKAALQEQVVGNHGSDESLSAIRRMARKAKERRQAQLDGGGSSSISSSGSSSTASSSPWTEEELSLLSKATVKFPPGSRNRWYSISNYINAAGVSPVLRDEHECAKTATAMKSRTGAGGRKQQHGQKTPGTATAASSSSSGDAAPAPNTAGSNNNGSKAWTEKEQRLLESGLKKFGAIPDAKEKWRSIAAEIPGRSAKECLARFKAVRAELLSRRENH